MGKKVKKKARSGQKDKRVGAINPKKGAECDQNVTPEGVVEVVSVVKERKGCVHLDLCMDLGRVCSKIELADGFRCEDCREGVVDWNEAKGKQREKKGSDSKGIWVCLECGHFACGGVGTSNQSHTVRYPRQIHAVRHARQSRHPLVVQVENPDLRWCFSFSLLIPVDRFESGQQKDVLSGVAKLFKKQPSGGSSVDVWFGSGSVLNEVKSISSLSRGRDFNGVKRLTNLGNTCYFNSVLQNLLAMDRFRDNLLKLGDSTGPLTNSLQKLFAESGVTNVLSPKTLFGCVCSMSPQFKGNQQQDSHELLHCLLGGFADEDLCVKKSANSCPDHEKSSHVNTSFVDAIFGGQLSSTVSCVECGYSSVVYEPYLDLSFPPRKVGNTRPKHGRDGISAPVLVGPKLPSEYPNNGLLPTAVTADDGGGSVDGSSSVSPTDQVLLPQGKAAPQEMSAWMDYLEPTSLVDQEDWALQPDEGPANQDSGRTYTSLNPMSDSFINSFEDEVPLQSGDSQVLLLPYKEEAVAVENFIERDIEPSSSAVANGEDMFNEPEVIMGPHPKPSTGSGEDMENGFLAGHISESNPDEVDDTDSPMSIESCLSHFTKPELLADAWHCHGCTIAMLEMRKRKLKPLSVTQNGSSFGVGETNQNNGTADSDRELQEVDTKQIRHVGEVGNHQLANGVSGASEVVEDGDSGESDEEEADSKNIKAMRNATKRILISKLPPILTIHLKGFNQDARDCFSKLNGHVVFKEVVDLRPYMDPRYDAEI